MNPADAAAPGATRDTGFGPVKQIEVGDLDVGYLDIGPSGGRPVLLLHGWPYDIHAFADVAPILAERGYRVIVPHLRGYGTTRFRSPDAMRNGQQAALAVDAIDLLDALAIRRGDRRGLRLGRPNGRHHGGPLAGALHGPRLGERIPDRQPGGQQAAATADCRAAPGGISSTSRPSAGVSATGSIGGTSRSSSGRPRRQRGTSTTRRSNEAPHPWRTRITLTSSSTTTAGGSAWPGASLATMTWSGSWSLACPSPFPRSPSKATRTVLPIRRPPRTGRSSSDHMPTG